MNRAIPVEKCVITGLFHNAGKAGFADTPYFIKNPDQQSAKTGRPYIINRDCPSLDVKTHSLYLISQYIELDVEETQAIAGRSDRAYGKRSQGKRY